jgi:hypothetical protein
MSTWPRRHLDAAREPHEAVTLFRHGGTTRRTNMWRLADRAVKAVADVTVGTVIVLVHVALADRKASRALQPRRLPS